MVFGLLTQSWWYGALGAAPGLLYRSTEKPETDDQLLLKDRWSALGAFLTGARQRYLTEMLWLVVDSFPAEYRRVRWRPR